MLEVAVIFDSPPLRLPLPFPPCQPWRRNEQGEDCCIAAATKSFLKGSARS